MKNPGEENNVNISDHYVCTALPTLGLKQIYLCYGENSEILLSLLSPLTESQSDFDKAEKT